MAISVFLADDHPVVRRGMQSLLEGEPDFTIAGVAADGPETVRLTEQLKPDVLVLDLALPGMDGLKVLEILRETSPETRVVILSMYSSTAFIAQALQGGATGYVLKGCPEENLVRAVREAAVGKRFLSPPVVDIAIDDYIQQFRASRPGSRDTRAPQQRTVPRMPAGAGTGGEMTAPEGPTGAEWLQRRGDEILSNRERQVLRLIGLGNSVKEIAAVLAVSEKTVSTYRSRILFKLELKSTAELIRYAVINRLTD